MEEPKPCCDTCGNELKESDTFYLMGKYELRMCGFCYSYSVEENLYIEVPMELKMM